VFTAAFYLEEGGKVHGWISSPDETTITDTPGANGLENNDYLTLPDELEALVPDLTSLANDEEERAGRVAIWRQLQAEATVAIMARLELEKSFGSRVDEVAGESLTESSRLRDEVSIFREERSALQEQIEVLEDQLLAGAERFETKSAELAAVRSLLDDKDTALEALQAVFEQQNLKTTSHESARQDLEAKLTRKTEQNEELVERVANLESALQGSLQHTAEQEEALIRWQELAEITEAKAATLGDELEAFKLQLKESSQVVDMLRTQRDKLEKEWTKANKDLMEVAQDRAEINVQLKKKSEQLAALEKEQAKLQESFDALQARYESQPPEYERLLEKLELVTANNSDLKDKLKQAEMEAQVYHEQWLWTKASLDTTCSELDDIRQSAGEYEENLRQLQEQIREQEITVENWKNSVGRMTNLLYEAENKAKELEKAADQVRIDAVGDEQKERLEGEIRKQQLQIEAYEAEVTYIHEEIEKQSRHLAEMQATLIEREISLNKSQETAERQAVQLEHVKRMAGKRIRGLEAELAQTQQKLKDLSVWLERRQRRGENLEEGKT
jgi:chromosome segregation ATPase